MNVQCYARYMDLDLVNFAALPRSRVPLTSDIWMIHWVAIVFVGVVMFRVANPGLRPVPTSLCLVDCLVAAPT